MLTFQQFKRGPAKRIAASCPNSAEFMDQTNDAVRQLMRRGNWWGTVVPLRGCVRNNCITWPRQIESVLAVKSCGAHIPVTNMWGTFLPWDEQSIRWACDGFSGGQFISNVSMDMDGTTSVFNPIPCGSSMYVQFYPSQPSDKGKSIVIYGLDASGQTIRSKFPNGEWQEGYPLTLTFPYVQTPFKMTRFDRIVKAPTNGPVRAYQWDGVSTRNGTDPLLFDLASYDASETAPEYLHSRIRGGGCASQCNGLKQIAALVKLAFVEIQHDDDLVLIDNTDAIRDMIMSIREKEAQNIAQSQVLELSAIRELNLQLRNRFPIEQLAVDFRPYGSARLSKITTGFI